MKIGRIEGTQEVEIVGMRCDRCGLEVREYQSLSAQFARYEYLSVDFTAGYGAKVFDDGTRYSCDLCEQCVKELLGPYLRSREPTWFLPPAPDGDCGGRTLFSLLEGIE